MLVGLGLVTLMEIVAFARLVVLVLGTTANVVDADPDLPSADDRYNIRKLP
jgi:hypothetical protein